MIYARSSRWFKKLFFLYQNLYLLPKFFHTVCVKGTVEAPTTQPTVYIGNHSSWWDGLLLFQLTQLYSKRNHYVMMEEEQLRSFRFFSKLGAFSIYKKRPRAVMASLHYAADLLQQTQCVWVFPQGDIQPLEKRPLAFQSGLAYLLKHVPEAVVKPVTFYYAFDSEQKPTASVWFGEPIQQSWQDLPKKEGMGMLQEQLEAQLNAHRQIVLSHPNYKEKAFRPALKIGRSTSDRFLQMKGRMGR